MDIYMHIYIYIENNIWSTSSHLFFFGNQVLVKKSLEVIVENLLVVSGVLRFNMFHQTSGFRTITVPAEFPPIKSHWIQPKQIPALSRFGPRDCHQNSLAQLDPLYKQPQAHGLNAVWTKQHRKATVFLELSTVLGLRSFSWKFGDVNFQQHLVCLRYALTCTMSPGKDRWAMSLQMTTVVDATKFLKDRTPWHHGDHWQRDCPIPWWGFQC